MSRNLAFFAFGFILLMPAAFSLGNENAPPPTCAALISPQASQEEIPELDLAELPEIQPRGESLYWHTVYRIPMGVVSPEVWAETERMIRATNAQLKRRWPSDEFLDEY